MLNYNSTTHMTIKEVRAALARRTEFRLLDISGSPYFGYDWAIVWHNEPSRRFAISDTVRRADGKYPSVFDRVAVEELLATPIKKLAN